MYETNTVSHVRVNGSGIAQPPPLMGALFKLTAALTYHDFLDAVEMFAEAVVPHQSRLAVTGIADFKGGNLNGMLGRYFNAPAPGAAFVDMQMRTHLLQKQRKMFAGKPEVKVWHRENEFSAFGARSSADLHRTEYHRRVAQPERWCDSIYVPFWANGNIHSSFWIKRAEGEPFFSRRDFEAMEHYYPWLKAAFDRVHLLESTRACARDITAGLFDIPVATLLLDWDLRLQMSNTAAARMCAAWHRGPKQARVLKHAALTGADMPAEICAACDVLRGQWLAEMRASGIEGMGNSKKIWRRTLPHPVHAGLEATVTLLRTSAQRLAMPSFLVRIVNLDTLSSVAGADSPAGADAPDAADARRVQLLARLTQAERDVVPLVAKGLSDKEIATALGKSVPTVKKQLCSIYEKLRVPNRARLTAVLR